MDATERKKIKSTIEKELKARSLYEKVDQYLIEELLYQFELLEMAKADITVRGIQINVRQQGEPFYNLNQSVSVVQTCTRTIQSLMRQLQITPQERAKIKLDDQSKDTQNSLEMLQDLFNA